ncbi:hypothetical protein CEJ63_26450, partial [Acinetobacter baumannii]
RLPGRGARALGGTHEPRPAGDALRRRLPDADRRGPGRPRADLADRLPTAGAPGARGRRPARAGAAAPAGVHGVAGGQCARLRRHEPLDGGHADRD